MPGGFHPFHAGHASLYQSALKAFPDADVYVAATNDTKTRPFPFSIKEKLAKLAGVQQGRFIQVKSPFKAEEITSHYNPNEDVLIFVRSEKDKNEQPKPGGTKKDGSPSYFQPWTGKNLQPFSKHAYMAYLPTVEFGPGITSATEIRNAWPKLDDRRKTAMVMSLYPVTQKNPKLAANVVKMLDMGMGSQAGVAESVDRINSDMQPRLSGLSFTDLNRLAESAGSDFSKFDSAIKKNLNLPKWADTIELYGVYVRKLSEGKNGKILIENEQSNIEQELFSQFTKRTAGSINSAKVGDKVSLLHLVTLNIPGHKIVAKLNGFLTPKEIAKITNAGSFQRLEFADGSRYPEKDGGDIFQQSQGWNMTKLFPSHETAEKAYLLYALFGNTLSKELDFQTSIDRDLAEGSELTDDLVSLLNSFDYYSDNGNVYVNDNGDKIARIGSDWKHQNGQRGTGAEELGAFLSSLNDVNEGFGLPMPGTYEQENNKFKRTGAMRITDMTENQDYLNEE